MHLSKTNIYYFRNHEQKIGGRIGLSDVKIYIIDIINVIL